MLAILSFDIKKYILFTYPFGWEELGVIATVAAVVVALWANRGARKQLKSALDMQEQSKNVSLLEQRVKIAESIQNDESPSMMGIKVLFNDGIYKCYEMLCTARMNYRRAQQDEQTFFEAKEEEYNHGPAPVNVRSKIEEYEYFMERPDCPQSIFDAYQEFCNDNEAWWSETGLSDDRKTYNHYEIRNRMIAANADITSTKKELVDLIEKFITDSIAPVK